MSRHCTISDDAGIGVGEHDLTSLHCRKLACANAMAFKLCIVLLISGDSGNV